MSTTTKKAKKASTAIVGTPVERLFAVLNLAAKMGMISAADIVYLLDLPRPTAHRMIATLEELQFLQKMPVKGKYAVAPKLVGLATSILSSTIVYAPIQALLTAVAQKTGETCGLALMSSGEVEYIASVMGQSPLTLQFQAGQKAPLHCTSSGQIFLAALPPDELAKFMASGPWEPLTPKTVTAPKVLLERLRKVKNQGYAANESEYIAGVVGAAVPIQNTEGQVVAALTISAPKSRRTLEDVVAMVPTLTTYADRIRRAIQPR
ncbi:MULTISPECIES: IclR family transcriptional regulator [unclassified Variovorax]|uniref:IclR family transcriptional regulator n=1 Tax=unclassified Variovorax TaxID=663243 RepID=UPI0034E984CA